RSEREVGPPAVPEQRQAGGDVTATQPATTARALVAAVGPFGPVVENDELVVDADPPPELVPVLEVLQTGVRALLAARRWYGCDGRTGRVFELHAGTPVPGHITLLSVEGDTRWD